jgi:hypothetical protein
VASARPDRRDEIARRRDAYEAGFRAAIATASRSGAFAAVDPASRAPTS